MGRFARSISTSGTSRARPLIAWRVREDARAGGACRGEFHTITAQQLTDASLVLTEMENRLAELASVLDPTK